MSGVQEAIKKAQTAAGELVDDAETLPAPVTQRSTQVAAPIVRPSMSTMGNTDGIAAAVQTWLKVQAEGLKIGNEKGLIDEIKVRIKMVEDDGFFVKQSIKWGQPVNYVSTYDGITSEKGGSWHDEVARINAIEPGAKVFPSADIIMELAAPVKLKEKTIAAGVKIGHTTSLSNWRNWNEFYREVADAGLLGQEVEVKVSAEEVNGNNGYTWGVLAFELV